MNRLTAAIAVGAMAVILFANVQSGRAQNEVGGAPSVSSAIEPKLELTPAQRSAIYRAVSKDKSKAAAKQFPAVVGADVPPMIELYALPDDAIADNSAAKFFQYTMVRDQVVLVDPTKMRVIDVIGPAPR